MRFHALAAAFALALLLGLSACGGSPPPPATSAPAQPATVATPAAPQFADLRGARASSGQGEMERRGFSVARQQGLTAYWLHASSNTCVRTVTSQGRYQTVDQVPPSNCGR
ncbi:MAG: hypothetical protein MUC89_04475 [Acetobacteraceae bacterium]|jgi:hypothetical protein|nr:hypothetical protein [Acetobacteraceae bacterium]